MCRHCSLYEDDSVILYQQNENQAGNLQSNPFTKFGYSFSSSNNSNGTSLNAEEYDTGKQLQSQFLEYVPIDLSEEDSECNYHEQIRKTGLMGVPSPEHYFCDHL